MAKLMLTRKHIHDETIHVHKSGVGARQASMQERCRETAARFMALVPDDTLIQYDMNYGNKPRDLRYTEIFAAAGGIMVNPCCGATQAALYRHAVMNPVHDRDNAQLLGDFGDKYVMWTYPIPVYDQVVILPGSNILEDSVDKGKLNTAADCGAMLKPHPLTNQNHMKRLEREYPGQVLPRRYSGWKVVETAKVIWGALGSELGLWAELNGRKYSDISTRGARGGYVGLHRFIRTHFVREHGFDTKTALNRLLNSPSGGVFFPWSTDEDMRAYLNHWRELAWGEAQ